MSYPRPATCHPETCVQFSPDVSLVVSPTGGSRTPWIVECDYCGTVVATFEPDEKTIAERIATEHAGRHWRQ